MSSISLNFMLFIALVASVSVNCSSKYKNATNNLLQEKSAIKSYSAAAVAKVYENTSITGSHLKDYLYSPVNLEFIIRHLHESHNSNNLGSANTNWRNIIIGKLSIVIYNDLFMHRYDRIQDLRRSSGQEVNQELCLNQLENMIARVEKMRNDMSGTLDSGIQRLVYTFGRVSSGYFGGRTSFTGAYSDCIETKLITTDGQHAMKYCYANMKHPDWNQTDPLSEYIFVKTGVCLPKTCDAMDYKKKLQLTEKLLYLVDAEFKSIGLQVDSLYCLPDEDSPSRQWWTFPATRLFVGCMAVWLSLLIYSTVSRRESDTNSVFKALSITRNLKKLARTDKDASLPGNLNLDFLDGIKVLCTVYVFLGHTLMCLISIGWNAVEEANRLSFIHYAPYLVPAFAVNTFFVVTGLITTYLVLKANESHSFIMNPFKWFGLIIYRYLRIMPTYLIFALFAKHVARFLGSGPFWDYATSSLASRRACENESILWTVLFGANFKSPFDHCLPPGWSLANDFQFFLMMPILIPMLYLYPKFAQAFMKLCIALGSLASFNHILQANMDFRPAVNFELHGLKYQLAHIADSYTFPQYRIPSYLMGILFGYTVYNRLRNQAKTTTNEPHKIQSHEIEKNPQAIWSRSFIKLSPSISLSLILICSTSPVILSRITFSPTAARFVFSLLMPAGHLLFSWAVGSYIMLASTGYGNKSLNAFLSLPFWKPLANLSLAVLLANVEVIQYFTQNHTELLAFNTKLFLSLYLLTSIVTYLAGAVAYLIVEAPIRNLLSLSISRSFSMKQMTKEKRA